MRLLLDTHLLLWAAGHPQRLPASAKIIIADTQNDLLFSVVSLWEVAIKQVRGYSDFKADARELRHDLAKAGYEELAMTGAHAVGTASLPPLHKDPFDRLLLAQAILEGLTLLTADRVLGQYPGPVLHVSA